MSLPPPTPDDEIVSAVLDDAATADERARVAADPRLQVRLQELRAVRDAVAAPVEPLDEVRERRLRDTALVDAPPNATEAAIAWTTATAPRRRATVLTPAIFGVAALVLLLLVAVPLLGSIELGGNGDDSGSADGSGDEATALSASEESSDDAGGGMAGESEGAGGDAPFGDVSPEAAVEPEDLSARPRMADLGPFRSVEAVIDHVAGLVGPIGFSASALPSSVADLPPTHCPPEPIDGREGSSAYATVQGDPVVVHVRPLEVGRLLVEVVDAATCEVLDDREVLFDPASSTTDAD